MNIVEYGLYKVKDEYFNRFKNEDFKDNKAEKRPHYLSFKDKDNLIWFIPMSSQVENYQRKINKDIAKYKDCLFYYIADIHQKKQVFLIGKMFPVTSEYILAEYTYSNIHYVVKNKDTIKQIRKRANKYLTLVNQGRLKPNIDIMTIRNELLKK
jgi:hypothetical protein